MVRDNVRQHTAHRKGNSIESIALLGVTVSLMTRTTAQVSDHFQKDNLKSYFLCMTF